MPRARLALVLLLCIGISACASTSDAPPDPAAQEVINDPAPPEPQVNSTALAAFLPILDDALGFEPAASTTDATLDLLDAMLYCVDETADSRSAALSSLDASTFSHPSGASLTGRAAQHRSPADSASFAKLQDPTTHQCASATVSAQTGYAVTVSAVKTSVFPTDTDLLVKISPTTAPDASAHHIWFASFGEFRTAVVLSGAASALTAAEPEFSSAIKRLAARAAR